ncbi:hypothetical protein [Paracoccus methylarcula]|uniref:DUF1828 domain-containing protein n=1 Tax=Paracoccus methylarcula TaxID=72022 RepID=A0A422QVH8_9RHOB|nr:hypothetical protein [Paracoccus methylarcula]RNF33976.1 hypothetical protein A7A09_013810 [Paracoccus methylarcula]
MTVKTRDSNTFQDVVRAAASQLVSHELISGGHYVTTPLMYASGGYVVIRVEQAGDEFLVSDFGAGHEEASLINGETIFKKVARSIAEANGVQFDSYSFFVLRVSKEQLPGAIATIANSSQEAVNITAMKVSERKHRDDNTILYERLSSVFGRASIARDAHILGASNTEWHVSSLVTVQNHSVAFEAVSKHPNSIVHAAAKFSDIARINDAPGRVAVVSNKKALGTYLGVLAHNANVIERRVDDQVYQNLLEAA